MPYNCFCFYWSYLHYKKQLTDILFQPEVVEKPQNEGDIPLKYHVINLRTRAILAVHVRKTIVNIKIQR